MPKFDLKVPFTQEWKDTLLKTIECRRVNPRPSIMDCHCCQKLGRTTKEDSCDGCPIRGIEGWCPEYENCGDSGRMAFLNRMEKAVNRRKVVDE